VQLTGSALYAIAVSHIYDGTLRPMATAVATAGLAAVGDICMAAAAARRAREYRGEGSMSRIAPVPPQLAPPDVRAAYEGAIKKFGKLPVPIAVTAHHPEVFAAYMGFERAFGRASKVDAKLTTLAAVKVASLVGSPF
jgi:hypothetical protein